MTDVQSHSIEDAVELYNDINNWEVLVRYKPITYQKIAFMVSNPISKF